MLKLGLIGRDISHSRSQEMYEKLLEQKVDYHLLDFDKEEEIPSVTDLFKRGFQGLSITYPYKKAFLSQVTIENSKIKDLNAINCMKADENGIFATNTDYLAAEVLLKRLREGNKSFVVLGNGNMARIFVSLLNANGDYFNQLSRSKNGNLNELDYHFFAKNEQSTLVVINCCSRSFIFKSILPENSVFWDMNYSMPEHYALRNQGINYIEGTDLLELQAKFALDFWKIETL